MSSKLYVIATPLGNRNDITLRALEMLKEVNCFFAEDSRELRKLMELHAISASKKAIHSYAKHNMKEATSKALKILETGESVGLVTDRGTPCISDPGFLLVQEAREAGHEVIPIPGPSSVIAALSVAGLPVDRFLFLGFLPLTQKERKKCWEEVRAMGVVSLFFESPKRIGETILELSAEFPHGKLFTAREMTKMFEEYELSPMAEARGRKVVEKGEFAVAFNPGPVELSTENDDAWQAEVRLRLSPDKQWAKAVAERYQVSASTVYNALQKLKN